ncbi:MAG: VCBS repeat-containing protein [Phycisphaerae bacterium]
MSTTWAWVFAGACVVSAARAELTVVTVSPPAGSMSAPTGAAISVTFDRAVDPATLNSQTFWAFGRQSGAMVGGLSLSNSDQTVTLAPSERMAAGEQVIVVLSHDLRAADGTYLRSSGFSWLFNTRVRPAALQFTELQRFSTNIPAGASSRPYGGLLGNLDADRWLDLVVVNEDTNDLRMFLNQASGTGSFGPMLLPTTPVGTVPSPSDSGDFNRDGLFDVCVSDRDSAQVSILLGNGDGTFAPAQNVTVGLSPLGIVAIDVDGDGDLDIAVANRVSGNVMILRNDGAGVFGSPTQFDAGVNQERALAAADMNGDGLLDLIVGGISSQRIAVALSNGDGTFAVQSAVPCGGAVWGVGAADMDGDGNADVVASNSSSNNFAVLFGDGAGGLSAPVVYATDPFVLAVDMADFDGDGDVDVVSSSYGGEWRLYLNDGAGVLTFDQAFPATAASSCSIAADIDNDRDPDLILVDEQADEIIVLSNSGVALPGDADGDCDVDLADLSALLTEFGCSGWNCAADIDDDGDTDLADLSALLTEFGAACP